MTRSRCVIVEAGKPAGKGVEWKEVRAIDAIDWELVGTL
jgi:hypothetical protein